MMVYNVVKAKKSTLPAFLVKNNQLHCAMRQLGGLEHLLPAIHTGLVLNVLTPVTNLFCRL